MKILLIEDEDPKRDAVLAAISGEFLTADFELAKSVRSAVAAIKKAPPDLLLLDMSLPTFDIAPGEPGGRPQSFGGIEVLRFLDGVDLCIPTIVITAYEAFPRKNGGPIGFEVLTADLRREYPSLFKGLIQFDPIQGQWSEKLRTLVKEVLGGPAA